MDSTTQIIDFTDAEARAALICKWAVPAGVIPAWVAEMDYRIAEPITRALHAAIDTGVTGYPSFDRHEELGAAYAGFAARRFGHKIDPAQVLPVSDVTAGIRLTLDAVCEPGPMILPVPAYPPQLEIAAITGRERVDLTIGPDDDAELDPARLDELFAAGARTLLLTQPHNPWGRVFSRAELEAIRDVVHTHRAMVITDEIHAPLVLPGKQHTPYLSIEGTADHTVAVVAASKAFNTAGLRCAQLVTADRRLHERLRDVPMARNDSWSPLGVIAAISAYTEGDAWLDALITRLDQQRTLFAELLEAQLPLTRMRPLEATYLAWLDLSAYGYADPAAVCLQRGRVKLNAGHDFDPTLSGHARINLATSPERLTEIVRRMATALN